MSSQQQTVSLSKLGNNPDDFAGGTINPSPEYLQHLERLRNQMRGKASIRIELLSDQELVSRIKCRNCGMRCSKRSKQPKKQPQKGAKGVQGPRQPPSALDENGRFRLVIAGEGSGIDGSKKPVMNCRYHHGKAPRGFWTCCNRHSSQPGCKEAEDHEPVATTFAQLRARFQHVPTYEAPIKAVAPHRRIAVAIDCEMGTSKDNEPEVIRLTLIDYFTSEVLIDSLVWPDMPMLHYNTRYSGVSRPQLVEARRTGKCIMGLDRAREMVWKYVDASTYVIGHSLSSDLSCMRWLHHTVVDSYVLEHDIWQAAVGGLQGENRVLLNAFEKLKLEKKEAGESVESLEKPELKPLPKAVLSLKDVTMKRFGRKVQGGKAGHDSLEDAVAARNLVDWHVRQSVEREESKEDLILF